MKAFYSVLKEIDFYGKEPEFYMNRKAKKVTVIGRIFTAFYIIIYFVFFIYKLIRLFTRSDLSFYDSDSEGSEDLSMHITKEDFYFNFALINSYTGEPFLDETVFQPYAFFNDDPVEIRPCTIDKFGSHYKDLIDKENLDKFYCYQDFNFTLKAYTDSYYIQVYPCQNSSENNNHCKSPEVIDEYINGNDLIVNLQDVIVTPKNYSYPVERRITDIYSYLFKNIGQYIYIEIQIANIETNTNLIGFDFLTHEKEETYIRYDLVSTVPTPGYQDNTFPICEIEIQLKDKYFTEKRSYPQLFDVLGEVGGFMESISSFFGLICSFIVNILYENTITNHLFSFDLQKRVIKIKNEGKHNYKMYNETELKEELPKEEKNVKFNLNMSRNNSYRKSLNYKATTTESIDTETNFNQQKRTYLPKKAHNNKFEINQRNKKIKLTRKLESDKLITFNQFKNNIDLEDIKDTDNNKEINNNEVSNINNRINNEVISNNSDGNLINEIHLNKILVHIGFCCIRSRNNLNNILLDESKNLLSEKLDIINIFKMMCLGEEVRDKFKLNNERIQMSNECQTSLENIDVK